MKVVNFISDGTLNIPDILITKAPSIAQKIWNYTIPIEPVSDSLHWTTATDGVLTSKLAYSHLTGAGRPLQWCSLIWFKFVPPSRSFIMWRIAHNKLPTDENLRKRGCYIVSVCCFCKAYAESTDHLFFGCAETAKIWKWLSTDIDQSIQTGSWLNVLTGCIGRWSRMLQEVMLSAVLHIVWCIWIERNNRYFHDKVNSIPSLIQHVIAEVRTSYSYSSGASNSSVTDFKIAQLFNLTVRVARPVVTFEVRWLPPKGHTIKVNVDGSAIGNPSVASIGVVFRDKAANFIGGFVHNIGNASSLMAELCAVMFVVERAVSRHWFGIWIETDSLIVTKAFQNPLLVPWGFRNRWSNCMLLANSIDCICTHIHREGNQVANALAKNGHSLAPFSSQWWDSPPSFLLPDLLRDSSGQSYQRITMM